jgi:DNA-binding NtrC family response regulator
MTDSILIIDDDVAILRVLGTFFEGHGWDVYRELNGEEGIATFERALTDVVLVDLNLPGMDGFEILERLRGRETAVIVLTGDGDVPTAVRAMQSGAENFLTKPFNLAQLQVTADRAVEKVRLRRLNRTLIGQSATAEGLDSLGSSPLMREVARQVTLLAHSDRRAVLLQGENGTGKQWLARLLHDVSPRGSAAFIEVACGAGDAAWLEAELFGHDTSAAADASGERRPGLLEVADGGTLFLDEIGDLPLEIQAKLLAMIESRAIRRPGGTREIPVDVRVIAATGQALSAAVEAGRFRQDLYYCLNVAPVTVPPLRERSRDDFLALIRRFLKELAPATPGAPTRLSEDALDRLLKHAWPGNVTELRNVLERALLLARGTDVVGTEHLPPEFRGRFSPLDRRHTPMTLDELERMHIDRVLKHHDGNRTHAALELGISRATLIAKIKRYAIPG